MSIINTKAIQAVFIEHELDKWADLLPVQLSHALEMQQHGDLQRWMAAVGQLPDCPSAETSLTTDVVSATVKPALPQEQQQQLSALLQQLHPWRKGPYSLLGIDIDTEWRSDLKWQRLIPHIRPLKGRQVLDVGCGNGYHCWRMAGEGAKLVVGIDPGRLFLAQFLAVQHFLGQHWPVHLLPLKSEDIPPNLQAFDTVFSMGILYHRRSPIDHLLELKGALKPGGELILETLVITGDKQQLLVPEGRYAKMRNVWFIPSVEQLIGWMQRCGFKNVRAVDSSVTTSQEQRGTEWMHFESLSDFLDPDDSGKTIEGYPAPLRAIIIANT